MDRRYKNPDNDPRGVWTSGDCSVKTYNASCDYPITTPSGRIVIPPAGYCWRFSKESFEEMVKDNRIWFGEKGDNVPRVKRFLADVKQGSVCKTIWYRTEVGDTQEGTKNMKAVFGGASAGSRVTGAIDQRADMHWGCPARNEGRTPKERLHL